MCTNASCNCRAADTTLKRPEGPAEGGIAMTEATYAFQPGPKDVAPIVRSFNGASLADQGLTTPPDSNGAVDDRYFVEFINGLFSVYDKATGDLAAPRTEDKTFWLYAGIPSSPAFTVVDPRIVFIPDAGRRGQWLAVQLDLGNRVLMATTDPYSWYPDPRIRNWKASSFDLDGNDFNMLGYDANGVYIGSNCTGGPDPGRSPQLVFIPRANALAYPPQLGPNAVKILGPLKKAQYGSWLYPVIDQSGAGWDYETVIGVDNFSKRQLTFALISPQFGAILSNGRIDVEPFAPVPMGFRVAQPALFDAVPWYNDGMVAPPMGDGFNIWLAQTVLKPQYGRLAVRWYRLYIDPVNRQPGLAAWGEIFQPGYDHFNPSILSFGKDDYTIVLLSRSGDSTTPQDPKDPRCGNIGAYAALVRETASGSTTQVLPLHSGQVPNYLPQGGQRWGDYSTICRDPDRAHPRRAWTVCQYAQSATQWCDVISSIELP